MTEEIKPGWNVVVLIWWALMWRLCLVLFLISLLVLAPLQFVESSPRLEELAEQLALLLLVPASLWPVRSALNKNYARARLILVEKEKTPEKMGEEQKPEDKSEKP